MDVVVEGDRIGFVKRGVIKSILRISMLLLNE